MSLLEWAPPKKQVMITYRIDTQQRHMLKVAAAVKNLSVQQFIHSIVSAEVTQIISGLRERQHR